MALVTHFPEPDFEKGCSRCGALYPKYKSDRSSGIFCHKCIDVVDLGKGNSTDQSNGSTFKTLSVQECESRNRIWKKLGY